MARREKIGEALNGAVEFVGEMSPKDWLAWLPFDEQVFPGAQVLISQIGEELQIDIRSTKAGGETGLYDAIAVAHQILQKQRESQGDTARYGMVVLSDGDDSVSTTTLPELEVMLTPRESGTTNVQVRTIGFGRDAVDLVLSEIATVTNGRYWKVTDTETVDEVYKRISKYW